MNRVPWNDDGRDFDAFGRLSIFTHAGRPLGLFEKQRYLEEDEFYAAKLYAFMNCEEILPYIDYTTSDSTSSIFTTGCAITNATWMYMIDTIEVHSYVHTGGYSIQSKGNVTNSDYRRRTFAKIGVTPTITRIIKSHFSGPWLTSRLILTVMKMPCSINLRLQTTQTHIYGFSTRIQPATLFAPIVTFEFACGPTPYAVAAQVSSFEIKGYQEMKINVKELKTDMHDIKSIMKIILERLPDLAGEFSSL
ncbi:Uncharacterized protein TCM_008708 [Theobroma cacao]|uniref:Uncharacterized protein n=1 Tax=Theobroma cacao TaxID=3641 RepID=A0A061E589_THECC|nr:Uncharacterized protein TCM_008708 [Theobroma cacao]